MAKLRHNCPTCQASYTLLETHLTRKDLTNCSANCKKTWHIMTKTKNIAQTWLDTNFPLENRSDIEELDIEVRDLEGDLELKGFTNLKEFYCFNNDLTSLDVSQCPKLEEVYCYANKLTELKLGNHPNLEAIYCGVNKLTSLDLTGY